jgi:diphthine-ammonia ligase
VEDLYNLLLTVKTKFPAITAVCSGAIFSTYQRVRVERVCARLNLTVLSYLWRKSQFAVMDLLPEYNLDARLIKVCSGGLTTRHLMKSATALMPVFTKLHDRMEFHVAGEGGEYETLVLDCDAFTHGRIVVDDFSIETEDDTSGIVVISKHHVEPKGDSALLSDCVIWSTESAPQTTLTDALPLPPTSSTPAHATMLRGGFLAMSTVTPSSSSSSSVVAQALEVFDRVSKTLSLYSMTAQDVVYTHVYLADISDFALVNEHYQNFFGSVLPPSRACVGVGPSCMPNATDLISMDCYAQKSSGQAMRETPGFQQNALREVLHVQGLSSWAPVCVGPYSQANILRGSLFLMAGMIGLIPETMVLAETWEAQLQICWRHAAQVLDALSSGTGGRLADSLSIVVYLQKDLVKAEGEAIFDKARRMCEASLGSNGGVVCGEADGNKQDGDDDGSDDEGEFGGYEDYETMMEMTKGVGLADKAATPATPEKQEDGLQIVFAVVEQMPKGALCEIELLGATRKASKVLTVEGESGLRVKEGEIGKGKSAAAIRWPCGFNENEFVGSQTATVKEESEPLALVSFEPLVDVSSSFRCVRGCSSAAWCVVKRKEGTEAMVGSALSVDGIMSEVLRNVHDCAHKSRIRISDIVHVRIYANIGLVSQSEVRASAEKMFGVDVAVSVVACGALEGGVLLACQSVALDLIQGETQMWVHAER